MSLKQAIETKRCVIVCGGGGVGKTTMAASIALAATQVRKKVLVVTIDPSKRLAEAFGFKEQALIDGGEPLKLSDEVKARLGILPGNELSVGILNPKYVLEQVLDQTLSKEKSERLRKTLLYTHMSNMIYGLQEYTAYEWVTRMIQNNEYDFIVLDTPPAHHAKDFFNVPERVKNLMESRVFNIFLPKKKSWFSTVLSFSFVEKLLGERIYNDSRTFFETFAALRERILERCEWLARFFTEQEVSVITVATTESSGQFELEGLNTFLKTKKIPLECIILNQVETPPSPWDEIREEISGIRPDLVKKLEDLRAHQLLKSERANQVIERARKSYASSEVLTIPMIYSDDGFAILRASAEALTSKF